MAAEFDMTEPIPTSSTGTSRGRARLFYFYNGYRLILAAGLLALLVIPGGEEFLTGFNPLWFTVASGLMLVSAFPLAAVPGDFISRAETGFLRC